MPVVRNKRNAAEAPAGDIDLVRRALTRDADAFRTIMQTHNRRLYRLARAIVRNDGEAEDIVQEAYVSAFTALDSFGGASSLSTWLSRIVINEALGRLRKNRRASAAAAKIAQNSAAQIIQFPLNTSEDPERTMAQRQILQLVERATDNLPDAYRTVFIARIIEGLSIDETAELLCLRPETVKTRLHRARHLVRKQIDQQIGPMLLNAFPFAGRRCERITASVMKRLGFPG